MGSPTAVDVAGDALGIMLDGNDFRGILGPGVTLIIDGDVPGGHGGTCSGSDAVYDRLRSVFSHPQSAEIKAASSFSGHQAEGWLDDCKIWFDVTDGLITGLHVMSLPGFAVRSLFAAYQNSYLAGAGFTDVDDHFAVDFEYFAGNEGPGNDEELVPDSNEEFVNDLDELLKGLPFSLEISSGGDMRDVQVRITAGKGEVIVMFFDVDYETLKLVAAFYPARVV